MMQQYEPEGGTWAVLALFMLLGALAGCTEHREYAKFAARPQFAGPTVHELNNVSHSVIHLYTTGDTTLVIKGESYANNIYIEKEPQCTTPSCK